MQHFRRLCAPGLHREAATVLGGAALFVGASRHVLVTPEQHYISLTASLGATGGDYLLKEALSNADSRWPSSVVGLSLRHAICPCSTTAAGIGVLGLAAAHPRSGVQLQQLLGPSATWLRASLPVILVPAVAMPFISSPDAAALPKVCLWILETTWHLSQRCCFLSCFKYPNTSHSASTGVQTPRTSQCLLAYALLVLAHAMRSQPRT